MAKGQGNRRRIKADPSASAARARPPAAVAAPQALPVAAPAAVIGVARKRVDCVQFEDGFEENKKLKATFDETDRRREAEMSRIQVKETELLDRLSKLNDKKREVAEDNGKVDVSDNDKIKINAGGKFIEATRGTLTQLPDSRLAALFSGRWDKKLIRDDKGRIFLDVNGDCFQVIVEYLVDLALSSEDNAPALPTVDDEMQHVLAHLMNIFGLTFAPPIGSTIVTQLSHEESLIGWLKETKDGSETNVGLELLYRSSRDGVGNDRFHSKCDEKGPTVVIIETTDGGLIGGYTNTSWTSKSNRNNGFFEPADEAFLFALSGFGLSSPCKMPLKNADQDYAISNNSSYGPSFGSTVNYDLRVKGNTLHVGVGNAYKAPGPRSRCELKKAGNYKIKELEVFLLTNLSTQFQSQAMKRSVFYDPMGTAVEEVAPVEAFAHEENNAINEKWAKLRDREVSLIALEESFKDEAEFVDSFASADSNDIVKLNILGTKTTTSRQTLMICKDSKLAKQFDDSKWKEQGCIDFSRVKSWTPDDVTKWVKTIEDVPNEIAALFSKKDIKGSELLAMDKEGLQMLGVERLGTRVLLHDEIKELKEASKNGTLIEHNPYCFGKILDHLRLMRLYDVGLIDKPDPPTVCESEKESFEKIVDYCFPGDSAKFILG